MRVFLSVSWTLVGPESCISSLYPDSFSLVPSQTHAAAYARPLTSTRCLVHCSALQSNNVTCGISPSQEMLLAARRSVTSASAYSHSRHNKLHRRISRCQGRRLSTPARTKATSVGSVQVSVLASMSSVVKIGVLSFSYYLLLRWRKLSEASVAELSSLSFQAILPLMLCIKLANTLATSNSNTAVIAVPACAVFQVATGALASVFLCRIAHANDRRMVVCMGMVCSHPFWFGFTCGPECSAPGVYCSH